MIENHLEANRKQVFLTELGLIDYKAAWDIQQAAFDNSVAIKLARKANDQIELPKNYLYICEHPHVYTLGKSGSEDHLLLKADELYSRSIDFYHSNRGGDITYHGLGQIVGYPIIDLDQFSADIKVYMRSLEEVIIRTIAEYGLKGERVEGATGVWLDKGKPNERKICAFGVKTSRWITMHGWALNVNTDLSYFSYIVPCGIADKGVTSLQKELGHELDINEVKEKILKHFEIVFDTKIIKEDA
ncbi:MAG: lipoyl(octanoyl) transferase LipB [Chitinophagales bacterium]